MPVFPCRGTTVSMFTRRLKGEIWYIGKGEHESGGGIGQRCCSAHLGKAERDGDSIFPNHQWATQPIKGAINDALKSGHFLVQTIKVGKKGCCSLVEVTLQTICLLNDGHLPPLNNKIG